MDDVLAKYHAEEILNKEGTVRIRSISPTCLQASKKKQISIVFDCSARFAQTLINDYLLQDLDQLNCRIRMSSQFRKEQIAITRNVKKMFDNFVSPNDKDYLCCFMAY